MSNTNKTLSLSTGCGKSAPNLEGIVDDPLETGEGTNHEDSCSKTFPESGETNFTVDFSDLRSGACAGFSLVEDGDHGVSWVGNDGAEDTSDVTGHEGDQHLSSLAVFVLWLGENGGIELLDNLLEGDELDNSAWNLSAPEWDKTLVESVQTFSCFDLVEASNCIFGEFTWFSSLHSYFKLIS